MSMKNIVNFNGFFNFQYPLAALISILYITHNVYLNNILKDLNITSG